MTGSDLPADIRELLDRQAIVDRLGRYCRAIDRLDRELGQSVFHADGRVDLGSAYQGDAHGAIDFIIASHSRTLRSSHQLGSTTIAFDAARDSAGSETYFQSVTRLLIDDKPIQYCVWGRYLDQWSKRDGEWAIAHRRTVFDFDETAEVTGTMGTADVARDRSDPSYSLLGDRNA